MSYIQPRSRISTPHTVIVILTLALGGLAGAPAPLVHAAGTTITVTSAADLVANDGLCTLPEAVTSANSGTASGPAGGECAAGGTSTTIEFAPALSGQTIALTTAHDSAAGPSGLGITSDIIIDGSAGVTPTLAAGWWSEWRQLRRWSWRLRRQPGCLESRSRQR